MLQAHWRIPRYAALAAFGCIAGWFGSSLGVPAATSPPKIDPAAEAAIQAANADWLPALKRADAAALAAPYAEDGLFVTKDGRVIRGRAAVQDLYAQRVASIRVLTGEIVQDGRVITPSGLIYEWGHATLTFETHEGGRSTSAGPYLTVWSRGDSGRWEIIRNLTF